MKPAAPSSPPRRPSRRKSAKPAAKPARAAAKPARKPSKPVKVRGDAQEIATPVPFIRRTRDKRGYENTYVMHAYRPAQGPHRTRILYVFRSPAGSRIGRDPLDGEVQEALEHTHPDLTFDWQALLQGVGRSATGARTRTGSWSSLANDRSGQPFSSDRLNGRPHGNRAVVPRHPSLLP